MATDRFRQRAAEAVFGSAALSLAAPASAGRVPALQMDFDFKGGGGFVVARRALKQSMPEEYTVNFRLRGHGAVNHVELKLIDATGQNVWRHVQKDLRLPLRWKRMTVASRDIDFAWGPSSGGRIRALGSMEFAIVAGEGGKGTLWIADVEIEDCSPKGVPRASASSALPDFEPAAALLGAGWKPRPDDPHPWIVIDSIEPRTIGGLIVDWLEHAPAAFVFAARTADFAGKRCTQQQRRAANAATCICLDLSADFFVWNSMSHRRARLCVCNRSSSRVLSMPSGTTSRTAKRAAGTRVGYTTNKVCGRPSAPQTAFIVR